MLKMTYRFACVILTAALFGGSMNAQSYLHQVFVLNEGWSNWQTGEMMEPVTLGVYDPGLQSYAVVDTLEDAGFVSDAFLLNERLYVAADGQLLMYDANSFALLASTEATGIRRMAHAEGLIYITRGDVDETGMNLSFDAYLQWFDAETLLLEGELQVNAGPQYATEGIVLIENQLFIGVNNAFDWGNEVGKIGRFDLNTEAYQEWDLGEEGKNPNHLFASGGQILSVNNRDYGSTSISVLNPPSESVETVLVSDANAGCLAAMMDGETLKYQITGEGQVRQSLISSPAASTVWLEDSPAYYGVIIDPVSGDWYGSVTDYSTYGYIEIRDTEGALQGEFDCGVSPGVLCADVRNISQVTDIDFDRTSFGAPIDAIGRKTHASANGFEMIIGADGKKAVRARQ